MKLTIRSLQRNEVTFTVKAEVDDMRFESTCETYDETVKEIQRQLDRGNVWAWSFVTVTAEWNGYRDSATLGGCSYNDESDFKEGDYYNDMCNDAFDQLNETLKRTFVELLPLIEAS